LNIKRQAANLKNFFRFTELTFSEHSFAASADSLVGLTPIFQRPGNDAFGESHSPDVWSLDILELMSPIARTVRFLTIHLLIVSIGMVGFAPVLMPEVKSAGVDRGGALASVQRCCCGTAGGVCCGMSCCGMQKSGQRPYPARNGNDHSGLTLLALDFESPDTTVPTGDTRLTRLAAVLCPPPGSTLQAMHVRLDA